MSERGIPGPREVAHLPSSVPPLEPSAIERNLQPSDSLVGRGPQLESLLSLVAGGCRLVTLWGPAGVGKTRLAREYGVRHTGAVVCVDLSQVDSSRQLLQRLAWRVGVGGMAADLPSVAAVFSSLDDSLLILDNFEQVLEAAHLVADLLERAPSLTCLVTSRERLRLSAERGLELLPLSLSTKAGTESDALRLFVLRARQVVPDFAPDPQQAAQLAELVRRLGGVPLLIELAAARLDLLDVPGLLERLDRPLDVLKSRARDAVPRQASLRAALDWSWQLLSTPARQDVIACTLFRHGFCAAAAEAVLAGLPGAGDPLERLQALRDKSLLSVDGAGLLYLSESLRTFALEHADVLPTEERSRLAVAHAAHYLTRAEEHRPPEAPMAPELVHNLLAVAEQPSELLAGPQLSPVVRAVLALAPTVRARGAAPALDRVISHILSRRSGDLSAEDHGRLRALHAHQLTSAGQSGPAMAELQRARELVAAPVRRAHIITDMGVLHHRDRDLDRAAACYAEALALLQTDGSGAARARVVGDLGAVHHDRREFDVAQAHYRDALQLLGNTPDRRLEGVMRGNLGVLEQEQGKGDAALAQYARAVDLLSEAGEPRLQAIALGNLGSLHHERDELSRAREYYEGALEMLGQAGDAPSEVLARVRLAAALAALGDTGAALGHLSLADGLCLRHSDPLGSALVDLGRGFVDAACAAAASAAGEEEEGADHLQRAAARIELYRHGFDQPEHVAAADDLRWLLRLLGRFVTLLGLKLEDPADAALVVATDGRFMRPPGGSWQDLRQHHVLRRMLSALVTRHGTAAGSGLDLEALQAAAWPSERIRPDAAANRIYVAIAKLRKWGLKPHLQRDHRGYYLDPQLKVVRGEPLSS